MWNGMQNEKMLSIQCDLYRPPKAVCPQTQNVTCLFPYVYKLVTSPRTVLCNRFKRRVPKPTFPTLTAHDKMTLTALTASTAPTSNWRSSPRRFRVSADGFPSFLPKEVEQIKDLPARKLASRIERLPLQVRLLRILH